MCYERFSGTTNLKNKFHTGETKISAQSVEVQFSGPVNTIHQRRLPENAIPAGYSALIDAYALTVPIPHKLSAIGDRHRIIDTDHWRIMTPRHEPQTSLRGHLTFALKYEGLDLSILKRLFEAVGDEPIIAWVSDEPNGSYARRIWFLYEWLLDVVLNVKDAEGGRYVQALDDNLQYGSTSTTSTRHRIKNNLPGTADFCPLVFRTKQLEDYREMELAKKALKIVDQVPKDLLARTAAFLLMKDSRSSYAIEGERPAHNRIQRWGRAISEAGREPLDQAEFLRLQQIVIEDARFIKMGFRKEGGFVGSHDRESQMPLPDHVSARHEDLDSLLAGMEAFERTKAKTLDPVISSAILAFGFVYIHPFEDGNGRLHRYIFHHVLAENGFNPPGVVFPISSAILERIDDYKTVLESYSSRVLPLIEWEPTDSFNVNVTNDTGDFYRFFDATPHAEFLYSCVQKTIEVDLPHETDFLRNYDHFRASVEELIDMPERTIDLLFRFLHQNNGTLSGRARGKELQLLTDDEATQIEAAYTNAFSI